MTAAVTPGLAAGPVPSRREMPGRGRSTAAPRRKTISVYGLTFALPMLLWQLP